MFCVIKPMRMISLQMLSIALLMVLLSTACDDKTAPVSRKVPAAALFLQEPLQEPYTDGKKYIKAIKDGSVTISPVATYRIAGVVMSKRKYSHGWGAEVAPFDIAMVWGMLTYPHVQKQLAIKHDSTRMAWIRIKGNEPPVDMDYAMSHGSNNHIIPSTPAIYKAIDKQVEKHDKIILEGYLVNVEGRSGDQRISMKTSLSRTDTDRGACEIIYVTRLQSGEKIYE